MGIFAKNEQTVFILFIITIKVTRAELSYNSKISQQNEINY